MRSYRITKHDVKRNQLHVQFKSESGTKENRFDANYLPMHDEAELDAWLTKHINDYEEAKQLEEASDNSGVKSLIGKSKEWKPEDV